ncbi:MAG: hypothetical protein K6G45_08620 [Lachnospiraceae bacterium]|nr:hypothetical protein [Lachnospiraceae bacterium]MCR5768538.1 hypothetical protein [Lachnospiraceae bacterium]
MLNNRKVRIMTQLAIYEKKEGRPDFRLAKYYKMDYARFNALKTILWVTIAYIVGLILVAIYKLEYLLDNAMTIDYKALGWTVLGIYLGIITVYVIGSLVGYSIYYTLSRKKLGRYYKMLGRLRSMYKEEDEYK